MVLIDGVGESGEEWGREGEGLEWAGAWWSYWEVG